MELATAVTANDLEADLGEATKLAAMGARFVVDLSVDEST